MRRLSFSLLSVTTALLAVISVGSGIVGLPASLYSSWPMMLMWGATAVVSVAYMARLKLWRQPVVALMHLAFAVILIGALLTHLTSDEHELHLRLNSPTEAHKLVSCDILTYPGTDTPRDFNAVVTVADDTALVSLNKPATLGSSRLLLKSFDTDNAGVTIIVSHDPMGRAVTFGGYILLAIAMLLYFFIPGTVWRQAISQVRRRGTVAIIFAIGGLSVQAVTIDSETTEKMMHTAIFHNGRICPVGTLARDFTVTLTGKSTVDGYTSAEVFTGYLFDFGTWRRMPVIKVKDSDLRHLLNARDGRCSYDDWFTAVASGTIDLDNPEIQHLYGADIARFEAVNMLVSGALLKIFPVTADGATVWYAPTDRLPESLDTDRWMFVRKYLGLLNEQILVGDTAQANTLLDALDRYQRAEVIDSPSPRRLETELIYNSLTTSPLPTVIALACAFIMTCGLLIAPRTGRRRRLAGFIMVALMWIWLTLVTAMRWYVSRHIPLANGYDTMMLMAWIASLVSLLYNRYALLLSAGTMVSALAMAVAAMSGAGASVTPLMPVLSSPLLTVHVLLVMSSYVLFALMTLISVYGLTAGRHDIQLYTAISRVMLYPALMALGAGIFIGAVWADMSWGRYWGWDPKEVWALITFIIYSLSAHRRLRHVNDTPRHYLRYTLMAFLSVIITYCGVNYLLGGLHSYV